MSSRFALIGASVRKAKARPDAIDSVKLISAIPTAAGNNCVIKARSGSVSDGNPFGTNPTIETHWGSSPSSEAATIPPPTATRGAGECGQRSRHRNQ